MFGSGGRLPSLDELRKVVSDCGGIKVSDGDKNWSQIVKKNEANKSYQKCYKVKGFTPDYYRSSTIRDEIYTWMMDFSRGNIGYDKDSHRYGVRCILDGK